MARSGPTTTSSRRLALQGPTAGGTDEIHGGQRTRTRSMVSGTAEIHGGQLRQRAADDDAGQLNGSKLQAVLPSSDSG